MAKSKQPAPRKSDANEEKERTSFYIKADTMKSIKLISVHEEKSITELLENALQDFVNKWENKHGQLQKVTKQ